MEKTLLSFTVSVNAAQRGQQVECFECRSCGLQTDLFSLAATGRQHPVVTRSFPISSTPSGGGFGGSHGFGASHGQMQARYRVCWKCGESGWHRVRKAVNPGQVTGIACPQCAEHTENSKEFSHQRPPCNIWVPFPAYGREELVCQCCAHFEPATIVLRELPKTFACSLCRSQVEQDGGGDCKGHLGPVIGKTFICCGADVTEKECKSPHGHSRY